MTAFEEFGVLPEIARAVDDMEWNLPTDVQAEAIPLILGGGDVLLAAETGSGKTGAFCLPILQIVWETLKDLSDGKTGKGNGASSSSATIAPCTMSFFDRSNAMSITPDGLRCQSREQTEWHGCRATTGVHGRGRFYYEVTITDEGLCRVGWSTQEANLNLGTDKFGFGFGGTGRKSNNNNFNLYGEAFGKMDVIGCLLDTIDLEVRFTKNGVDLGQAFQINVDVKNKPFFPAVVLKNAELSFNFGKDGFKFGLPSGYVGLYHADDMVKKPNALASGSVESVTGGARLPNAPQAIIIEPSRELAEQTFNQIGLFKKFLGSHPIVNEMLLIGGSNVREQLDQLKRGVDIIVATPGRLEDLISGGQVSLTHCRFFVLDEADALLKAGYNDLCERIHKQIPKITSDGRRLQMIVCSATLHDFAVKKLAERLMHFPTWVDLKGEDAVPETVHHVVALINPQVDQSWRSLRRHIRTDGVHSNDNIRPDGQTAETFSEAVKMLKAEYLVRAIDEHKMERAIIFCRTKLDCDNLEMYLKQIGGQNYSCVCLHSDRSPQERKENLAIFKAAKVKFIICTDVAARGIDITGLPYVINFTLPDEKTNYVHRIGRVGRADHMGLAISLVSTVPEKVWYHGQWCSSRGKNCQNTNLTNVKGCCVWYNEKNILAEIEDHLIVTIQQIETDMRVPKHEFDGNIVYGGKRKNVGSGYVDHVSQMVPVVQRLAEFEAQAQTAFLQRAYVS